MWNPNSLKKNLEKFEKLVDPWNYFTTDVNIESLKEALPYARSKEELKYYLALDPETFRLIIQEFREKIPPTTWKNYVVRVNNWRVIMETQIK